MRGKSLEDTIGNNVDSDGDESLRGFGSKAGGRIYPPHVTCFLTKSYPPQHAYESEIIEVRVQAAIDAYANMEPKNAALAARLHNAPPNHVY